MAINNNPIFSGIADFGAVKLTAANTKSDGQGTIGTDMFKLYSADSTNGSYISAIRFSPYGTAAATNTTATVIRIYISSLATGATTDADTHLIAEIAAASQSADNSSTATFPLEYPLNRAIPPGYHILVSIHAAPAANTGWKAVCFAGKYTAQA
jgi:hypothetical protein